MTTNEGRVYFALDGEVFDPDELTEFLGIEPTSIQRKGAKVPGRVPKTNSWQFSTENVVNDYIDVFHLSSLVIEQLKPKKDLILKAKEKFSVLPRLEVVLSLSMNEQHSTPAIGFHVETMEFLGEIGAFVDIDTYKH
ncbi:DUF4279 domain-containing protein [uncultured Microbulbifer sp.]|uniref:DUF4279 domain-containing protein n=1 Tax=uncultured Microbulbifer sp. TaxID=348147 RepID=UPI00262C0EF9|nr:DUF4279 domain-containing protein [uncultured Microbulbifer sp.]